MSGQVTPDLIKRLRSRTGVGVGKCKQALMETDGDLEKAIQYLRTTGMASAVKKEEREAKEGCIGIGENGEGYALVEIRAETDFVVNNDRFQEFVKTIADEVAKSNPADLEAFKAQKFSGEPSLTVDEYRATVVQAIGENIQIHRLQMFPKGSDESMGVYSHKGGKIVSLVALEGAGGKDDVAKEVAMHVVAECPDYLQADQVPEAVKAHEEGIIKSQLENDPKFQGKPENMIGKIIEGKMGAFYDQICLQRQKFVKDPSVTIDQFVANEGKEAGADLKVKWFERWTVG